MLKKLVKSTILKISNVTTDFKLIPSKVSGSAAMPEPIANKWSKLTGTPPLERYGMTEFGMGLSQPYNLSERASCSVGLPMSTVRARIRDGDHITEIKKGLDKYVEGHLEILSPGLLVCYWRAPEKTAEEFTGRASNNLFYYNLLTPNAH
jgi:malonyl-CoA/methylmalonyl-CoA synthetase